MRLILPFIILMIAFIYSCGQDHKSTIIKESKDLGNSKILLNAESFMPKTTAKQKNIDSRYTYIDTNGHNLIIENSFPRGGLKYKDPKGEEYVYAVFWTRITNETNYPFEMIMKFTENSYKLESSPARFFKLFIPTDTFTNIKEPQFNYGLDLEKYLDNNYYNQAELKRTIGPKASSGFYVITLFNKGVNGTLRTGLRIKDKKLIYRINDKKIYCGNINLELKN